MSRRAVAWLLFGAIATVTEAFADELSLRFNGELGAGYDSNVGNAASDPDVRDSSFASGALHAASTLELSPYVAVQGRGTLRGDAYNHFDGLSNGKVLGQLRLMWRTGGGFHAPTLSAWASAAYWDFDSAIRDSTEYRYGAFLAEQLSTKIRARVSVTASERDSESRVFDLTAWSADLDVDWSVLPMLFVYGGYRYQDGDVVSSGSPTAPVVNWAEVIEPDDAFGGFATNQFAYRLDARSHVATLGVNVPLTGRVSVDAQVQSVEARARGGLSYDRWIGVASVLARF